MFSKRPIRVKLLIGLALLLLVVVFLSSGGLYGTYIYRDLAKTVSWRAAELPLAGDLSLRVSALRVSLSELRGLRAASFPHSEADNLPWRVRWVRDQFRSQFRDMEEALSRYRVQLERNAKDGSPIADNDAEWTTVHQIEACLTRIDLADNDEDWILDDVKVSELEGELETLQELAGELPSHLHHRFAGFAANVRGQYRALLAELWTTTVLATLLFALFVRLFYRWVFCPLGVLIRGSRRVAAGEFRYRIHLNTHDEMAELASAMNDMTERFETIRDDLDRQVQERTRQVVRSEQLASVGFLAAGVAHEINNPLASIAMCAESIEGRMLAMLEDGNDEHAVIREYLRMIQNEAFRCKEITEKLLDFSRVGEVKRQETDLAELVQGVIDMLGHLGRYQRRKIEFHTAEPIRASVNAQEMKQVVLNLLTNALDSIDENGEVGVNLSVRGDLAELVVTDNGCGMTPDVLEHLYEPFFTRRRGGGGTGLGLSITYRIVTDHGGDIEASSAGPARGSTFRIRLPLAERTSENPHLARAA